MRTHQPLGPDSFPRSMLENTTEFDWDELPNYLKDVLRGAARAVNEWAAQQENPIVGEVVPDAAALPEADLRPHIKHVEAIVASHVREVLGVHVGYGEEAWCPDCREHWPCEAVKSLRALE